MVIAIMMITIVVVAIVMIAVVVVEIVMVEIVMTIVHHMFEIPARLLVIMFERLVIFANQTAVADVQAAVARQWPAIMVMVAMPDEWAIATIPLARIMDVAVVLAMPRLEVAIVVAPPVAVAAILGAAPPSHIGFAFAEAMLDVAFVVAFPSVPATFVVTTRTFIAFVAFAMPPAIAVAAVMELDRRDRIERIEQNGIGDGHAAIFVRAARLAGDGTRGHRHDECHCECSQQRLPGAECARGLDALRHSDLPQWCPSRCGPESAVSRRSCN